MTTMLRDAWADATAMATQDVLDDDVAAARRRAGVRQALVLLLAAGVIVGAAALADAVVDSSYDDHSWPTPHVIHVGFGLEILGFVLMMVGWIASTRAGAGSFLRPDSLLGRSDRAWLRHRIAECAPVPPERQPVAVAAARRLVADVAFLPSHLGYLVLLLGLEVSAPLGGSVVVGAVLAAWTVLQAARTLMWARRSRRWLARNA